MSGGIISAVVGGIGLIASIDAANNADHDRKVAMEANKGAAATESAAASEMLAYYRERDAEAAALQAEANAIAGRVADAQIGLMDQQRQISGEYHARNKDVFWPLEDTIVADAKGFDTPGRRAKASSDAMAGTEQQLSLARAANNRNMTRMGVNPNSTKFGLSNNALSLGAASAKAAAGQTAEQNVETQGWARRLDAANLGKGLASAQATAASTASSAGANATNAAYAPVNAFNAQTAQTGAGLANAFNMQSNAGRLALSGLPAAAPQANIGAQLAGLGGQLARTYYQNQGAQQAANLNFANGVTAGGGDGLGAFISANNNWMD